MFLRKMLLFSKCMNNLIESITVSKNLFTSMFYIIICNYIIVTCVIIIIIIIIKTPLYRKQKRKRKQLEK